MPASTPQDARHEFLEPYLQRVGAFLRARGDENRPITIPSAPAPLTLSAEERKAAFSVLCGANPDWTGPQAWIALGAGLHLAVATALDTMSRPDEDPSRRDATDQLAALRAAAASFTERLRQAIADMLASGHTDDAKRLSSFRNKLIETLAALRNVGATDAPTEAQVAAPAPVEADVPQPAPNPAEVAEAVAAPDAPPAVDPALDGYLRRAAAFLRARGKEDRPLAIAFGKRTLAVNAWERRILWNSLSDGQAPAREWHCLIPQYVALQLAMLLSLDELERPGRSQEAERSARLDLQTALKIASGVVEAFRAEISRAVSAGAVEDAKTMSATRANFAVTLVEARRVLAEEQAAIAALGSDSPGASGGPPAHAKDGQFEALRPFLHRAEQLLRVQGHEDRPLAVPIGRRSWSFDKWERRVLWKVLCEESPGQPEWSLLLAHGAAAQLAALLALERLRKTGEEPEARAAAEADRDTAVALLSEISERLQTTGAAASADGQEALGEHLAKLRGKLTESVNLLNRTRG